MPGRNLRTSGRRRNDPGSPSSAIAKAKGRKRIIAAKQRTTLSSERLTDTLTRSPFEAFVSSSAHANARPANISRRWQMAFDIGSGDDYYTSGQDHIGEMFRSMFYSKLDFVNEDKWQPAKPLGNGSFGAAGLFKRADDGGENEDFVVAKYALAQKSEMVSNLLPNLSKEAAIMMQLNDLESYGTLFLRNYRYFQDREQWLFLSEYCPSFDTELLRLNYKAMRQRIPEPFLWYMLYGFAKGLVAMEHGPFGRAELPSQRRPENYVLHHDLKPPNIFLGYAPPSNPPQVSAAADHMGVDLEYPHVKIADFGLSEITSSTSRNRAINHRKGSKPWRPPEVRYDKIPPESTFYPFEATCFDRQGSVPSPLDIPNRPKWYHSYTPAGNTFVVGFMMFQFMTLDEPFNLHDYMDSIMSQEVREPKRSLLALEDMKGHLNWLDAFDELARSNEMSDEARDRYNRRRQIYHLLVDWNNAQYGPNLKLLVERCLAFRPEDRIPARELLSQVEAYLPMILAHIDRNKNTKNPVETKVFTTEADFGDMTPGKVNVFRDRDFWHCLVKAYQWMDTSAGVIRPEIDRNDHEVPREAHALFASSRGEEKNKKLIGRGLSSFKKIKGKALGYVKKSRRDEGEGVAPGDLG